MSVPIQNCDFPEFYQFTGGYGENLETRNHTQPCQSVQLKCEHRTEFESFDPSKHAMASTHQKR